MLLLSALLELSLALLLLLRNPLKLLVSLGVLHLLLFGVCKSIFLKKASFVRNSGLPLCIFLLFFLFPFLFQGAEFFLFLCLRCKLFVKLGLLVGVSVKSVHHQ